MLLRFLLLSFLLVTCGYAADHNVFKNCSRVDFCNRLRQRTPQNLYTADLSNIGVKPYNTVNITLLSTDKSKQQLVLTLTVLKGDIFRVEIAEENSKRYRLQDVLDGDPVLGKFDNFEIITKKALNITAGKTGVVVYASPLSLEFSKNGIVHTVIDGSRLLLENTAASNAFTLGLSFKEALLAYGLHEHADRLSLRETKPGASDPYRLRNLDVAGYELNSPMSLYGAIPLIYGQGTSHTSGVFLHNAAEQWYDISYKPDEVDVYVMVETGSLDLFVLSGPTPEDAVVQYASLTGTHLMPPLWSLGYHQCRWNYDTQEDVKDVLARLDKGSFPVDAIWLDIEYTNGKRYFTWDPKAFSDPTEMQANISSQNRKLVTIIDPHIKVDKNYSVYAGALKEDLFVKNANGTNFEGDCWPGLSSYMDFLNPDARSYYADMYDYDKFVGSTPTLAGIWNDMNEPSVFDDSIEKTIPGDALHYGGVQHRNIHNIYGLLHTRSTHMGLLARDDKKYRPFILTRSHFAGSQRYAAIWTGDNTAEWGYLAISYSECLNANLQGISFCGADIGGFDKNPDDELLQRWYQAGAWLPFYRQHANKGTPRREPYLFSEAVQAVIRNALKLRYKHLPVWYTLFFEHTRQLTPVIRPLFYAYPADKNTYLIDNHLLLGKDILVRPVMEQGAKSVQVYFPGGADEYWFALSDGDKTISYPGVGYKEMAVDMNSTPVFYRSGSIIARKDKERLKTYDMIPDAYDVYIYLNKNNTATGTLYVDDYNSFSYQTEKKYKYVSLDYAGDLVITDILDGNDPTPFDIHFASVHIFKIDSPSLNGEPVRATRILSIKSNSSAPLFKLGGNERTARFEFE